VGIQILGAGKYQEPAVECGVPEVFR
jgi:hypothetical protein